MKCFPKARLLALFLAFVLAAGCGRSPKPPGLLPVAQGEDGKDLKPQLIADEAVRSGIWKDFLGYLDRMPPFADPAELPLKDMALFCWQRYLRDGGFDELEQPQPPEGETLPPALADRRLLPEDLMTRLIRQYFDRTVTDFSGVEFGQASQNMVYAQAYGGFLVTRPEQAPLALPEDAAGALWSFDACWDNGGGEVAASVAHRDSADADPSAFYTALLGRREDGTLYWKSLDRQYPSDNRAKLKGYYDEVSTTYPLELLESGRAFCVGQNGQSVFLASYAYDPYTLGEENMTVTFYQLSREDYEVNREMTVAMAWDGDGPIAQPLFEDLGDHIQVLTPRKIYRVAHSLGAPQQVALPPFMAERLTLQTSAEDGGDAAARYPDGLVGYDVSDDLTKFLYADDQGVHLYQLEVPADELAKRIEDRYWAGKAMEEYTGPPVVTGEDLLLEPRVAGEDPATARYLTPRFVGDESAVLISTQVQLPGGQVETTTRLLPLAQGEAPQGWVSDYPWLVPGEEAARWQGPLAFGEERQDGFPLVAERQGLFYTQPGEDPGEQRLLYYDWATGEVLQLASGTDQLPQAAWAARGEGRFGYLTQPADPTAKKARTILYALDPDAPQGTPPQELLSAAPGTQLSLLAVLDDHTYLCYYYAGPGEQSLLKVRETR